MASRLLPIACLGSLSGCAVYSPTVPSTPLVQKGQVELAASMRTLLSLDGSVAYSPINCFLISGEGAIRQTGGNKVVNGMKTGFTDTHRQVSSGVGAYQEFGANRSLYAAAVGGVGVAAANVHYGLLGSLSEYTANYTRYYGQLYMAQRGQLISGGASLRATWLSFNSLLFDHTPIAPVARLYFEPSFFLRAGKGALQTQLTVGISVPARTGSNYDAKYLSARSSLVSLGLVFQPALLKKRGDAAQ
ncbi:hypothetical protein [Hymenobacter sp. B1770]|uniref:hypothetical protein n=1 Tax=Hymenobacter sp. B1770 TaxID=1718788 RepID=UPI003CF0A02A